jgi:hypothetical protein
MGRAGIVLPPPPPAGPRTHVPARKNCAPEPYHPYSIQYDRVKSISSFCGPSSSATASMLRHFVKFRKHFAKLCEKIRDISYSKSLCLCSNFCVYYSTEELP